MKTKLTEQENYKLANELKSLTEKWVNTFNYIHVDVLNKCCDNMLFEYIEQTEPDYQEFINNYNLHDELLKYIQNDFEDVNESIDLFKEELFEESIKYFCEEENQNEFENWRYERESENYPMWNTCFEFKYEITPEIKEAAKSAGFGIIEGMEDFNTILFVAGAGYSFYGAHWIPAFLNMPWNSNLKEKYKDVNYSMM